VAGARPPHTAATATAAPGTTTASAATAATTAPATSATTSLGLRRSRRQRETGDRNGIDAVHGDDEEARHDPRQKRTFRFWCHLHRSFLVSLKLQQGNIENAQARQKVHLAMTMSENKTPP